MLILTFEKVYRKGKIYKDEQKAIHEWLRQHGNILDAWDHPHKMVIEWAPGKKVTVQEMVEWKRKLRAFWLVKMQ